MQRRGSRQPTVLVMAAGPFKSRPREIQRCRRKPALGVPRACPSRRQRHAKGQAHRAAAMNAIRNAVCVGGPATTRVDLATRNTRVFDTVPTHADLALKQSSTGVRSTAHKAPAAPPGGHSTLGAGAALPGRRGGVQANDFKFSSNKYFRTI